MIEMQYCQALSLMIMTQSRAVIEAIAQLGGIAPLGKIYEVAVKNPDCKWGTQTP